jgi:hypothetical protein
MGFGRREIFGSEATIARPVQADGCFTALAVEE